MRYRKTAGTEAFRSTPSIGTERSPMPVRRDAYRSPRRCSSTNAIHPGRIGSQKVAMR